MAFHLPNFSWPPPINGQHVFFSEKSFRLYSGTPDFATYLSKKQDELGGTYSEAEICKAQKPDQLKKAAPPCQKAAPPCQKKESQSGNVSQQKAKPDSGNDHADLDLSPDSRTASTAVVPPSAGTHGKPPVPFPQPSILTKAEQQTYLELCEKYRTYVPKKPTQGERRQINQLRELQIKVATEQKECQAFLEGIATQLSADYEYLHPDASKYMEEWVAERRKKVQRYARYYVQHDSVPLAPPPVPKDIRLIHNQRLLHMGEVPKASVPKVHADCRLSNQQVLSLRYDNITRRYPIQATNADPGMWNKQVVSEDGNCHKLAVTHKVDVVVSGSTLQCLLESAPGSPRQWELPVVIQMHTDHEGQQHKVVYIDKPFVPKNLTAREKNLLYHKFALKTNWLHPNHKGTICLDKLNARDVAVDIVEDDDTDDDASDGGRKAVSMCDDVFSCDSATEIDSLETFGLGKVPEKQMVKGFISKRRKSSASVLPQNKTETIKTGAITADSTEEKVVSQTPVESCMQKRKLSAVKSLCSTEDKLVLQSSTCSDSEDEKLIIDYDGKQTGTTSQISNDQNNVVSMESPDPQGNIESDEYLQQTDGPGDQLPAKRRRGRPPKKKTQLIPQPVSTDNAEASSPLEKDDVEQECSPVKKKRGRPPKMTKIPQAPPPAAARQSTSPESHQDAEQEYSPSTCTRKRERVARTTRNARKADAGNIKDVSFTQDEFDCDKSDKRVSRKYGQGANVTSTSSDSMVQTASSESDTSENETDTEVPDKAKFVADKNSNQRIARQNKQQMNSSQAMLSKRQIHSVKGLTKVAVASSSKTNPLEHILQGQEKLGQMGKQSNICSGQEVFVRQGLPSPPGSKGSVQYNTKEWEAAEDRSKFIPPIAKRNLSYDTWSLGNLKLLIRTSIHGNFSRNKRKGRHVVLTPKLEYQPCYGYEQLTHSEAAAAWTQLTLKPECQLIRARVNAFNHKVMMIEKIDQGSAMPCTSFIPLAASNILYQTLSKLQGLGTGQYLLSHTAGGTHATIKKTTASKKGVYDLHLAYTMTSYNQPTAKSPSQWVPLDTSLFLPHQKVNNRIPVTFEPRNSTGAGFQQKPWQKRRKKKKNKNKKGDNN